MAGCHPGIWEGAFAGADPRRDVPRGGVAAAGRWQAAVAGWGPIGYEAAMLPELLILERIEALRALEQWREPEGAVGSGTRGGRPELVVDARSNDYLGLAQRAVSRETLLGPSGHEGGGPDGEGSVEGGHTSDSKGARVGTDAGAASGSGPEGEETGRGRGTSSRACLPGEGAATGGLGAIGAGGGVGGLPGAVSQVVSGRGDAAPGTGVMRAGAGPRDLADAASGGVLLGEASGELASRGEPREFGDGGASAVSRETPGTAEGPGARRGASAVEGRIEPERGGLLPGAGASRLIAGTRSEHLELEAALADWLGVDSALLFSSGYAANVGVVSALAGRDDVVFSDALNHASLIDGCRLGRGRVVVFPHLDLGALERGLAGAGAAAARWVVSESYFGMDGDVPDLRALRRLCDRYAAGLVVDEAHALGVFGPEGRGLCSEVGVTPDVLVGGMGKAMGVQGGFAAGSSTYRAWLWNRARSFVFSTAPSPVTCRVALEQVRRVRGADEGRRRLREVEAMLGARLAEGGVRLPEGRVGPVFPIVFGGERAALAAARALELRGIGSHAVRPPTVPAGASRLRVSLRADMTDAEVGTLAEGLVEVWRASRSEALAPGTSAPGPSAADPQGRQPRVGHGIAVRPGPDGGDRAAAARARRWIVFGTGTGVGKTFVAEALVRLIAAQGKPVAGLKPVETGLSFAAAGADGDATRLRRASFHVKHPSPHPLFGFEEPIAPSLAARRTGRVVELERLPSWLDQTYNQADPLSPPALVVETAGGVFSPLSDGADNLDLAMVLGPAQWVLVAPDRLGVLHDVLSTLRAMESLQRAPDWLVLSAPREPDASTGTNAAELARRSIRPRLISLALNQTAPLQALIEDLHSGGTFPV